MSACDGCLGSRRCWVCLGTGDLLLPIGSVRCHRCRGTGWCALCDGAGPVEPLHDDHRFRAQMERVIVAAALD